MKAIKTEQLIFLYLLNYMMKIDEINKKFNEELLLQIEGLLPKNHTYQLGTPSVILQSIRIPNLPIELRASRLNDKAMQKEHPFDLREIVDLPKVIQNPLAIFRSATHLGYYILMTELKHSNKNFIVALQINTYKENNETNSIRSIYPKNNTQVINWIEDGLLEYVDKQKTIEWFSKQQSNSADVKKLFNRVAKIVQDFENAIN